MKKMKKQTYFCPRCGCDNILFEARAVWNAKKKVWDFHMESGCDAWCQGCDEEIGQDVEWGDPADWVEQEEDDE